MARKKGERYPSDNARLKTRPHVKVHLSTRSHPRYREVFEDLEGRAIIWGLWVLAVQYHAAQTGNKVALGPSDLAWISGRSRSDHARKAVIRWVERMRYQYSYDGDTLIVNVRNLQRKQGFAPTDGGDTPHKVPTPDTEVPNTEVQSEQPHPAAGDPPGRSPLLNLLAKEPGKADEKAAWLEHELPLIEAEAEAGNGSVKSLTIRYYRQYAKGDRIYRGAAAIAAHKARREAGARDPPRPEPMSVETELTDTMQSLFDES